MIIGKDFVWAHIPKTGGTSVETMIRKFDFKDCGIVHCDSSGDIKKHDTFDIKADRLGIDLSKSRKRILTIRRLPNWVLSKHNHKSWRLPYSRDDVINGVVKSFYPLDSLEVNDVETAWKSIKVYTPDSFLKHYMCGRVDFWMRTEFLNNDFVNIFSNFIHMSEIQLGSINKVMANERKYKKDLGRWFKDETEMEELYDSNPLWSSIEKRLYGDLLYEHK